MRTRKQKSSTSETDSGKVGVKEDGLLGAPSFAQYGAFIYKSWVTRRRRAHTHGGAELPQPSEWDGADCVF